jgi:hypothetical protein
MYSVPTTSVSLGSSSKKHFWTAPSMKKCSACDGMASAAARSTVDLHMINGNSELLHPLEVQWCVEQALWSSP